MNRTTKECRAGLKCEPVTRGEAAKCLLLHSDVQLEEIAVATGKSEGYLRKASNCDYEELSLQYDTVGRATEVTRNLVALRFDAARVGAAVVVLPTGPIEQSDILSAFAAAIEEAGKDGGAIQRALKNNAIDAGEAHDVCAEIDRTITAFLAVKELVIAKAQKSGAK
jgi:hypothetical protein